MASVTVRPGDEVKLVLESEINTPLGRQKAETTVDVGYDDLLAKLAGRKRPKNRTDAGTRFSRRVSLTHRAVETGKWSSGAKTDTKKVVAMLIESFGKLEPKEILSITPTARKRMEEMVTKVDGAHKKQLTSIVEKLKNDAVAG